MKDHASDFCQKKGITAAVAVMRHIKGGSEYVCVQFIKIENNISPDIES
jgi:hypothetical protein